MLVPTFNYFFTHSPFKFRNLSCCGTSFCMPLLKKSLPSRSASPAQHLLSLGDSPESGWQNDFFEVEKQVITT